MCERGSESEREWQREGEWVGAGAGQLPTCWSCRRINLPAKYAWKGVAVKSVRYTHPHTAHTHTQIIDTETRGHKSLIFCVSMHTLSYSRKLENWNCNCRIEISCYLGRLAKKNSARGSTVPPVGNRSKKTSYGMFTKPRSQVAAARRGLLLLLLRSSSCSRGNSWKEKVSCRYTNCACASLAQIKPEKLSQLRRLDSSNVAIRSGCVRVLGIWWSQLPGDSSRYSCIIDQRQYERLSCPSSAARSGVHTHTHTVGRDIEVPGKTYKDAWQCHLIAQPGATFHCIAQCSRSTIRSFCFDIDFFFFVCSFLFFPALGDFPLNFKLFSDFTHFSADFLARIEMEYVVRINLKWLIGRWSE